MLALSEGPAHQFLSTVGQHIERPRAILVVSAHWESVGGPTISITSQPETIHDFGGFPDELYHIEYPAPGVPEIAAQAVNLLSANGFTVKTDAYRGLDHGAWVPLSLIYPKADIPVFQISLINGAGPETHYRLGLSLQPLRNQGVLIIGSGSLTHNLREAMSYQLGDATPDWVTDFDHWVENTLGGGHIEALLAYRKTAPFAQKNHPTEEHFLPIFVALGAVGEHFSAVHAHTSYTYGAISMSAYSFDDKPVKILD